MITMWAMRFKPMKTCNGKVHETRCVCVCDRCSACVFLFCFSSCSVLGLPLSLQSVCAWLFGCAAGAETALRFNHFKEKMFLTNGAVTKKRVLRVKVSAEGRLCCSCCVPIFILSHTHVACFCLIHFLLNCVCMCACVPQGGILGDEVGLGKTLVAISLMLTNPLPNPHAVCNCFCVRRSADLCFRLSVRMDVLIPCLAYLCFALSMCVHTAQEPTLHNEWTYETGATLIVCPSHLVQQWEAEIKKFCVTELSIHCITTKDQHKRVTYKDLCEAGERRAHPSTIALTPSLLHCAMGTGCLRVLCVCCFHGAMHMPM